MNTKKTLASIAVAALAALPLAACSAAPAPAPSPSATPTQNAVAVYPERGFAPDIVKGASGKLKCDEKMVASTELKLGGTVSADGTTVSAVKTDSGITLTFDGGNTFAESLIVNGTIPSTVPKSGQGTKATALTLATKDFGEITSATLCGGGM